MKNRWIGALLTICLITTQLHYTTININGEDAGNQTEPTYIVESGDSYPGNPLKGMFPYSNNPTDKVEYSMEWFNIGVSAVHIAKDKFDWTALEEKLDDIASRGHHAAFRFYYTYPTLDGGWLGVPEYVIEEGDLELTPYGDTKETYEQLAGSGLWPDHSNKTFRDSMKSFIRAFGERYDGDKRIGFITLGLLGFWGEWHNWPYSEDEKFAIPTEVYKEVLDEYDRAFDETMLCVREPKYGIDYTKYDISFHDDSFAYSTLSTQDGGESWHFLAMLETFNQQNRWRTNVIGGELYPPLQNQIFADGIEQEWEDWDTCVEKSHISWMINDSLPEYEGKELERVREATKQVGYDFQVTASYYDETNSSKPFNLKVDIKNIGVAPFYYDEKKWPIKIGVMKDNQIMGEWMTDWALCDIPATGEVVSFETTFEMPELADEDYEIYMKVINPLENGNILGFANKYQRADGWLKIGELNYDDRQGESESGSEKETETETETEEKIETKNELDEVVSAWESNGYVYTNLVNDVDYNYWQVFFDTDDDSSTGMSSDFNGFDYMVEGGGLYVYAGTGATWEWTWVGEIEYEVTSTNIYVKIPKEYFEMFEYPTTVQYKLLNEAWDPIYKSDEVDIEGINEECQWVPLKEDSNIPVTFKYTSVNDAGESVNNSVQVNGYVEYYDAVTLTKTDSAIGKDSYITLQGDDSYYIGNNRMQVAVSNTGVTDNADMLIDGSAQLLPYTLKSVYRHSDKGEIQISAPGMFTVTDITTYYIMKITAKGSYSESVTYLPFRITVTPGDVEIRAYQMNTNSSEGGVSEFNPSFRVVSRAPDLMIDKKGDLHAVVKCGTLYAVETDVTNQDMVIGNDEVNNVEATEKGILDNWPNSANDSDRESYRYYAVTFKGTNYYLDMLTMDFKLKAYAVLDNGEVIYQKAGAYDISLYEIAENLYRMNKMGTKASHDYLYNHVLNIVAINNNRYNIALAMKELLNPESKTDEKYILFNNAYKDLLYYVKLSMNYAYERYSMRGEFVSLTTYGDGITDDYLIEELNSAGKTRYDTVAEWIYNEVPHNEGFYEKVEWNANNGLVPLY